MTHVTRGKAWGVGLEEEHVCLDGLYLGINAIVENGKPDGAKVIVLVRYE